MKRVLILWTIIVATLSTQAQSIQARWDTTAQVIGGTLSLTFEVPSNLIITPMDSTDALLWIGATRDTQEASVIYHWTALAVDTGVVNTEDLALINEAGELAGTVMIPSVQLNFLPAMEGVETTEARGPMDVPFSLWWWVLAYKWWLLGAVLAGLAAWWMWRRWSAREVKEVPVALAPEVDPYAQARDQLVQMREQKPWEDDIKSYYVALGDLVRTYLGIQSGLPLAEKTTDEALALVKNKWTAAQREDYAFIMGRADVVKFAKGTLDVEAHLSCLDKAEAMVEAFKPERDGE